MRDGHDLLLDHVWAAFHSDRIPGRSAAQARTGDERREKACHASGTASRVASTREANTIIKAIRCYTSAEHGLTKPLGIPITQFLPGV